MQIFLPDMGEMRMRGARALRGAWCVCLPGKTWFMGMWLVLGLAACQHAPNMGSEALVANGVDDPFAQALAQHYLAYAATEAAYEHTESAGWFRRKAERVLDGDRLEAGDPALYALKHAHYERLRAAREHLVMLLMPEHKLLTALPEDAAKAQAAFDCWLMQASPDVAVASDCQADWLRAVDVLEHALLRHVAPPLPEAPAEAVTVPVTLPLHMAVGLAQLEAESREALQALVRQYGKNATYEIYPALGEEMAEAQEGSLVALRQLAVQNLLMRYGVPVAHIIPMPEAAVRTEGQPKGDQRTEFYTQPVVRVVPGTAANALADTVKQDGAAEPGAETAPAMTLWPQEQQANAAAEPMQLLPLKEDDEEDGQ